MANYLCVKVNNASTKKYELKDSAQKPYLCVKVGSNSTKYLPLTTETGTGMKVKAAGTTYRVVESYTTTQTETYTQTYESSYDTTRESTYTSTGDDIYIHLHILTITERITVYSNTKNCIARQITFSEYYGNENLSMLRVKLNGAAGSTTYTYASTYSGGSNTSYDYYWCVTNESRSIAFSAITGDVGKYYGSQAIYPADTRTTWRTTSTHMIPYMGSSSVTAKNTRYTGSIAMDRYETMRVEVQTTRESQYQTTSKATQTLTNTYTITVN